MKLTSAQQTAFENAINLNANTIPALPGVTSAFVGVAVKNVPQGNDQDGAAAVAAYYNQLASPAFLIFNSAVSFVNLRDQILWASYTPAPAPDSTVAWSNCSLACQGKQFNLEIMLLDPTGSFDATRVNLRKGLKDATSALPSGTPLGISVDGGWNTSIGAAPGVLTRSATIFESLFAMASTGPFAGGTGGLGVGGAQGVANVAVPATDSTGGYLQGPLSAQDILAIWNP